MPGSAKISTRGGFIDLGKPLVRLAIHHYTFTIELFQLLTHTLHIASIPDPQGQGLHKYGDAS